MKDFYAILGLDPGASPESIKVTYRRLALECHPDRVTHLGGSAEAIASERMADLNEAYQTLSDVLRRKDYDEEFRKWRIGLTFEQLLAPVTADVMAEAPVTMPVRPKARSASMVTNVVEQFSSELLQRVLNVKQDFRWEEKRLEGFEWVVHSSALLTHYYVGLRGFATVDQAAARKFVNYATMAIEGSRKLIKRDLYLLLMPFQRMHEPDQVQAMLRRFAGGVRSGPVTGAQATVVLLDVTHGRSLPCGPRIHNKKFEVLLQRLGFAK